MISPVLLITFNRPEPTRAVLEAIRTVRPPKLFVFNDGPRDQSDLPAVLSVQKLIEELVDWNCNLELNYQSENLGCRRAVTGAIDWFFSRVEEGIILEDDVLPSPDFFGFCEEMLTRYRDYPQIMHISGENSARVSILEPWSYCFIRYPHIWGWATWKSAWMKYDRDLSKFRALYEREQIETIFTWSPERNLWVPRFKYLMEQSDPKSWDWQWSATLYIEGGLSVQPIRNLVSNIGFGENATHARVPNKRSAVPLEQLGPIIHPGKIERHRIAERQVFRRTQAPGFSKKVRLLRRRLRTLKRRVLRVFLKS